MTEKLIGVLLMAYGGPDSLDDIPAYLLDVREGRATSPELIDEDRSRVHAKHVADFTGVEHHHRGIEGLDSTDVAIGAQLGRENANAFTNLRPARRVRGLGARTR